MPITDQKTVTELHQIHMELSLIRKAICAYVEAKGVKVPGYNEPRRESAPTRRKKSQPVKRTK